MFCVTTALTQPSRSSAASARWPAFGSAASSAPTLRPEPAPDLLRVTLKDLDRRDLRRVDSGPETRGGAEVRDAALGADARPREHDARPALADQSCERVDAGVGHGPSVVSGPRNGRLPVRTRRPRAVRRDRRARHRASRRLRGVARGARVAYLDAYVGGYAHIRERGLEALTTGVHLDYHRSAEFHDVLRIWTRCTGLRGARFRYEYRLEREGSSSPRGTRPTPRSTGPPTGRPGCRPGWRMRSALRSRARCRRRRRLGRRLRRGGLGGLRLLLRGRLRPDPHDALLAHVAQLHDDSYMTSPFGA